MKIQTKTGNPIVDAIGKLNITGNVIPESWYKTIKNSKGKTSPLAIILLADIVYWYRPTEIRDEFTQDVTYVKKFDDKYYLQRSYSQINERFNISTKQARDALIVLEELGVVKRHFRNFTTNSGLKLINVMYLELIPDALIRLTYPDTDPNYKNVNTSCQSAEEAIDKNGITNTKNTNKTTTKTTTTPKENAAVVEAQKIFQTLNLPKEDVISITKAADYDIAKCQNAMNVLKKQTNQIGNVVGWLISAVRHDYKQIGQQSMGDAGSFHFSSERTYTDEYFDELERKLLAAN